MADEPRRSGRATKGQHKHTSPSPAPTPKATKAAAKSKPVKKSQEPEQQNEGEDEEIRCICGNTNPKDKRAFIGCDVCKVWQHNVCMGVPEDEDDVPDHYFCEKCGPEEHQETVQALANGERIWETRNKIYQNEKKMSKNRKGKTNATPGWLKKEIVPPEPANMDVDEAEAVPAAVQAAEEPEKGSKRKRDSIKEESGEIAEANKPVRSGRLDKRRKSSLPAQPVIAQQAAGQDSETAIVDIDKLPSDRQKIAAALCKIMTEVISDLAKTGYQIPEGHTEKSLGEKYATLVEYELQMTHGGPSNPPYMGQFRALNANLKRNKVLVERLLSESLTANELATMESKDMASEELQKERAAMKEQLDRQAIAIQEEGPRYRRTHKGDELIEDENQHLINSASAVPEPVRERMSVAEGAEEGAVASPPAGVDAQGEPAGSPMQTDAPPLQVSTVKMTPGSNRRQSSQNFDMSNIWAKTAGSPTMSSGPRPLQTNPHRRQSSVDMTARELAIGTKHDADVDRMLQDDDEPYSPGDPSGQETVWRGKLVQTSDGAQPMVNARWVAGRDITSTVSWRALMPDHLAIDGRLQIPKAEEYLCSLQWSNSSDVSVLALTPADEADAETFGAVFQYFKSRERYAVVNKDKPAMVRDMYIIPVEVGAPLPEHVGMLEHCSLKSPAEEKMLLASLVLARAPGTPPVAQQDGDSASVQPTNGQFQQQYPQPLSLQHQHQQLAQHIRGAGPAASPVAPQNAVFSPTNSNHNTPGLNQGPFSVLPPNPYAQPGNAPNPYTSPVNIAAPVSENPLVAEILGTLQFAPTTQQILAADPAITRDKLVNLRNIMESNPETRTDINALGRKLLKTG